MTAPRIRTLFFSIGRLSRVRCTLVATIVPCEFAQAVLGRLSHRPQNGRAFWLLSHSAAHQHHVTFVLVRVHLLFATQRPGLAAPLSACTAAHGAHVSQCESRHDSQHVCAAPRSQASSSLLPLQGRNRPAHSVRATQVIASRPQGTHTCAFRLSAVFSRARRPQGVCHVDTVSLRTALCAHQTPSSCASVHSRAALRAARSRSTGQQRTTLDLASTDPQRTTIALPTGNLHDNAPLGSRLAVCNASDVVDTWVHSKFGMFAT